MAVSRTMLSESFWRSSATTSAAALGASEASVTNREISLIVSAACACAWVPISCAVRDSVSHTACWLAATCAPLSAHCRPS
jgi:hypothetical protein